MKYAAALNDYAKCFSFSDTMVYFAKRFLNSARDYEEDGKEFFYDFGNYIDEIKFPCQKIILDPFTGYNNRFNFRLLFDGDKVAWLQIEVDRYGLMKVTNCTFKNEDFKNMFYKKIEAYFDNRNQIILLNNFELCGIDRNSKDLSINVDYYSDYKKTDRVVALTGTIDEIFSKFTSMNETLKYCNGDYYKFSDKNIENLYYLYTSSFKGNYFLMNAVKDGRLID